MPLMRWSCIDREVWVTRKFTLEGQWTHTRNRLP